MSHLEVAPSIGGFGARGPNSSCVSLEIRPCVCGGGGGALPDDVLS